MTHFESRQHASMISASVNIYTIMRIARTLHSDSRISNSINVPYWILRTYMPRRHNGKIFRKIFH